MGKLERVIELLNFMPKVNLRNLMRYIAKGEKLIDDNFSDGQGHGCILGVAFEGHKESIGKAEIARTRATKAFGQYPVALAEFNNECLRNHREAELYGTIISVALDRGVKA